MSKVKFKLNRAGVRELMKSKGMLGICTEHADAVQSRAGEGYEVTTYIGKNRANASVMAATYKARKDNLKNNTLLKALGGGR